MTVTAATWTVATLMLGYIAFGLLTSLIFTAGFLGGFLLWLVLPDRGSWQQFRVPYWIVLFLFLAHRVEEKQFGFFTMLQSVTGVPTPDPLGPAVLLLLLLLLSVGGWLLVPWLMRHHHPLGRYFAWTFLTSMGVTELAHWVVFPFLVGFHYVPGMWSVVLLAPAAWWGMWRMLSAQPQGA
jgi:hypothetical protein